MLKTVIWMRKVIVMLKIFMYSGRSTSEAFGCGIVAQRELQGHGKRVARGAGSARTAARARLAAPSTAAGRVDPGAAGSRPQQPCRSCSPAAVAAALLQQHPYGSSNSPCGSSVSTK